MEEFLHLGGSSSRGPFTFSSPALGVPPSVSAASGASFFYGVSSQNPNPNPPKLEPGTSTHFSADMDSVKAKIISHPQYPALLAAYMDCQKVGAPPEVIARLSAVARELEGRQQAALGCRRVSPADPELDQFMEAYCNMLVKYKEELTRPVQEAMDFLRKVESQLNSLTNGATAPFLSSGQDISHVVICYVYKKAFQAFNSGFLGFQGTNNSSEISANIIVFSLFLISSLSLSLSLSIYCLFFHSTFFSKLGVISLISSYCFSYQQSGTASTANNVLSRQNESK